MGVVGLSLLGALCTSVAADQLYVRNRPFKGPVKRSEGKLWVDLKTFAEAMGATVEQTPEGGTIVRMPGEAPAEVTAASGKVVIAGQEVESQSGLVPMETAAQLMGAKVVTNKGMGTIDVNLMTAASSASTSATPVAKAPPAQGPINKFINKSGSSVDVVANLVPGRINIVEFTADW
ncbi:hypothetical protein IV102_06265 [bacterium]|nr:hypothetical protein [bacterium]